MLPKPISKTSNSQLQILGWYQIIGGAIGLKKVFDQLWGDGYHSGTFVFMCIIALGLYCFSIYAGRLVLGRNYENALALTFINQLMQIFSFRIWGFGYMYYSGVIFKLYANYTSTSTPNSYSYSHNEGFVNSFLSNWYLHWNTGLNFYELGVNLVAIYLSYYSYRLYKQVRMERQQVESSYAVSA